MSESDTIAKTTEKCEADVFFILSPAIDRLMNDIFRLDP
jgi:hypothetical protein